MGKLSGKRIVCDARIQRRIAERRGALLFSCYLRGGLCCTRAWCDAHHLRAGQSGLTAVIAAQYYTKWLSIAEPRREARMVSYSGGCSCGAVRYEIAAEPIRTFQCQCRDCQKDTGSGHSSVMVFPRAAKRITRRPTEISRAPDNGAPKVRGVLCPS